MPLSSVNSVTLPSYTKLEDTPATTEVGDLKGKSVSSAAVDSDAFRLATRSEVQQTGGLKNRLLSSLSHLGEKIENFFKHLLPGKTQRTAAPQAPLSQEQVAKEYLQLAVDKGFSQVDILAQVSGSELKEQHSALATGNGALRTVATGLRSIQQFGSTEHQAKASLIFSQDVAGIPFQQWATTGATASEFVQQASAEKLQLAAQSLNHMAQSIADLVEDVHHSLKPNIPSPHQTEMGRKTALDAISFLAQSVAPSKQVHISNDALDELQKDITSNKVNFYQLQNSVVTLGDLQILRELALSTNPQSSTLNAAGNLGASINELTNTRPNLGNILTSVQTFIEESNQAWSKLNADKPEQLIDAVARSTFNKQLISAQLAQMPDSAKKQAYEQLDGQFGERMRGIIDFAVEKVTLSDYTQDDPVMISTVVKYGTVIEGLVDSLKLNLNTDLDKRIPQPAYISESSQLSPFEQAALSRVGITKQIIQE